MLLSVSKCDNLNLYHTILAFNNSQKEKGESACLQHFLVFQHCFVLYQRKKSTFLSTFNLSSANAFNFVTSEMSSGKE